jgi:hypothetical protein
MKCAGKIAVCLAGGLVLNTGLRADDIALSNNPLPGNPYAPVVVRNVFNLTPPPVVDPNATPAVPPVKITLNGIMSIFGQLQVLFKVAGKAPGQDAYTLGEGEQQDDIEVTKIDEKAGIVTFNNHGVEQKLSLVAANPSSTPGTAASPPGGQPRPGIAPRGPGGNNGSSGFINTFGRRGANFPGHNNGGNNGANNPGGMNNGYNGSNLQSGLSRGGNAPQDNTMSGEEQMIMIAAEHAKLQHEGNPAAVIFPPTPIDADAGVDSPPSPGGPPAP